MHRGGLLLGSPVVVRALPVAGPQHLAAVLGGPVVRGRALHRLIAAGRQQREAGGVVRRPRGGDPDPLGIGVEAQLIGDHEPRVAVAHAPLARAHGHGRVALGQLQRAEALVQRQRDVLGGDVLAEADDLLAPGLRRLRRHRPGGRGRSGRRTHHPHALRQRVGHVAALVAVVADAAAALTDERRLTDAAARHHQQVAGQCAVLVVALDDHAGDGRRALGQPRLEAGQVLDAGVLDGAAVGVAPRVGHGQHVHAAVGQVERGRQPLVARRQHNGLLPRHQPELVHQPPCSAGQHHARQVVVAEHQRLLDRAGGDHQLGRAEAVHGATLVDRHQQALVDAAGVGRLQDLDAGGVHPVDQRCQASVAARPAPGQLSAQREALLDQRNVLALLGRLGGRLQPGLAAADHQHVDVAVHLVEALGAAMVGVELAEAGCVAQDLFVERPGPARVDEGLVVEADLHAEAGRQPSHQVQ